MVRPMHVLMVVLVQIATLHLSPSLDSRFVAYGSRGEAQPSRITSPSDKSSKQGFFQHLLDRLSAIRVPHAYFLHFYIASVVSSCFWLYQILTQGDVLRAIMDMRRKHSTASMSVDQIILTFTLMAIQGLRRLAESIYFAKPSSTQMFFVHWLLGIVFYLAMGVVVWIEGADEIMNAEHLVAQINFSVPSLKTMLSVPIFLMASGIQHDCHAYLASLRSYSLPTHPIFNLLVCPHYTMECFIYFSMAVASAPKGHWMNKPMLTALIFVVTNLSVTASITKDVYRKRFGRERVDRRWKMLPGIW